ncbi:DUF5941 domain-containing protein [Actinomadura verrucosospora]|uniref:Integral membrane transferase n=1 Tax=Actinomadura verrucosospora TaxID=46165 RepID=A0A7D3VXD8_ACTVE|nr:DUF5941 domain-containing protein [Actinomadura verrucosospora]QKG25079.1 Integral membrane transferase [Actinomadura verrucosospora]
MPRVRPWRRPAPLNVPEAPGAAEENRGRPRRPGREGRGRAARHRGDGLVAAYAVGGYAPYLVRWAGSRGLTSGTVAAISFSFGALAAVWFSAGSRAGMITGAVLLYASFVLDCVDGGLARAAGTPGTAWPAGVLGRAKEAAVYAGLAAGAGAEPPGPPGLAGNAWAAAVAALALLTVRQTMDVAYATSRYGRRPREARIRNEVARRAVRALALPAGERFALIAVTAALAGARAALTVLLVWGSAAAAFVLAGRARDSFARPGPAPGPADR